MLFCAYTSPKYDKIEVFNYTFTQIKIFIHIKYTQTEIFYTHIITQIEIFVKTKTTQIEIFFRVKYTQIEIFAVCFGKNRHFSGF